MEIVSYNRNRLGNCNASVYFNTQMYAMQNFRKLRVWTLALSYSKTIYLITELFPKHELYGGLASQMRRAAVSIASNISEGCGRSSRLDFKRFLEMALGSAFELETQLHIAKEVGYLNATALESNLKELDIIQKQLNKLIQTLKSSQP